MASPRKKNRAPAPAGALPTSLNTAQASEKNKAGKAKGVALSPKAPNAGKAGNTASAVTPSEGKAGHAKAPGQGKAHGAAAPAVFQPKTTTPAAPPAPPAAPAAPPTLEELREVCAGLASVPKSLAAAPEAFYPRLLRYITMLMQWNARMNLVGATTWQQAVDNLCADSWHLADFLATLPIPPAPECWDFGAGAGLPGVPLRLVWEPGNYTLVEAREKRALFLQSVLAVCPLPGVKVFRGRVEGFMPNAPAANLVVSRAFMPWEKMLALVADFMAPDGMVVFLTLASPPASLPAGWALQGSHEYVAGGDPRHFWALRRVAG